MTDQTQDQRHQDLPILPRTYDGISTFAAYGDHRQHEYDKSAVSFVESYADEEIARAQQIAANERLTPEARAADVRDILEKALYETQSRLKTELESVEQQIKETVRKAHRDLSPSAAEVGQLTYVKDSLYARARMSGGVDAIYTTWERALDRGDTVTLRVLADFGEHLIHTARPKDIKDTPLGMRYDDLAKRTAEALLTPDQKAARTKLLKLEATRIRLVEVGNRQEQRLKNTRLQGNTLVERGSSSTFDNMRF